MNPDKNPGQRHGSPRALQNSAPLRFAAVKVCLLVLFAWRMASATPAPTNMTPIAVTGWNRDLVVESTAVGPPYTAYATELNPGEGNGFYQTGLPSYAWGLPPSGGFVSTIGDNTIFQFQPYTANNALVLNTNTGLTSGTLTLVTPAIYSKIAVVAHSANGNSSGVATITLNFSDGTTLVTNYYAPDWFNNVTNVAWFGPGRINLTSGSDTGGLENPRFYQTTINVAASMGTTNKPLVSVTFGKAQVASSTAIYCISGQIAASATPIAVAGFNRDVVVENTASGPPYTGSAAELYPGGGVAFYQKGLAGKANGLPLTGVFESAWDGALFQLQPYTGNNALVLSSETGLSQGTLTLSTPALYNSISILAHSANGGGTPSLTLNFADGSSFVTNYNALNWFGNLGFALQGFDDINLTSGATQGAPTDPRFYQTTLDLIAIFGATNKPLSSLTFAQAAAAGATAVYAVSGVRGAQTNGPFTLASVTNAPAGEIETRSAVLGGTVLSTGGDAPELILYYGTADGGTNAAAWQQRAYVGMESGAFAQTVTGLLVNTTYYFAFAAVNGAGTVWAAPSKSFATAQAFLAGVTNLPALSIGAHSALMSGQVLSTGGDAPTVTLYYGTSNGGNNSGSWANRVRMRSNTPV